MSRPSKYSGIVVNLLIAVAISLVVNFSYVLLMLVDLNSDNQPRPAGERIVERTDEGVLAVHPDGYGYLIYENGDSVYVPARRMRWLGIAPGDREVEKKAAACSEAIDGAPAAAIELADGSIVTGKTGPLLGAASSALLNALKRLAGIDQEIDLVSSKAIEPIQQLKTTYLGSKNPRLHTDEILIALSISAVTNPTAELAMEALASLRGSQVHSSVILSSVDEGMFKRLGMNVTFEPVYQSHTLYHK